MSSKLLHATAFSINGLDDAHQVVSVMTKQLLMQIVQQLMTVSATLKRFFHRARDSGRRDKRAERWKPDKFYIPNNPNIYKRVLLVCTNKLGDLSHNEAIHQQHHPAKERASTCSFPPTEIEQTTSEKVEFFSAELHPLVPDKEVLHEVKTAPASATRTAMNGRPAQNCTC